MQTLEVLSSCNYIELQQRNMQKFLFLSACLMQSITSSNPSCLHTQIGWLD